MAPGSSTNFASYSRHQAILDATLKVAQDEGWNAVSIRRIAKETKLSNPTIYAHFTGRGDIIAQLKSKGFLLLLGYLQKSHTGENNPPDRLRAIALSCLEFAKDNPHYYAAMYNIGISDEVEDLPCPNCLSALQYIGDALSEVLSINILNGNLQRDVKEIFDSFWAQVHGIITAMVLEKASEEAYPHGIKVLNIAMDVWIAGLVKVQDMA